MRCKSCFIGEKLNDKNTSLTYDDCVGIIESAAKLQTINSVAFVGGEPFLYYPLMLRVASYLYNHYMCPLNVSTNATWSKTKKQTEQLLDPLFERGLRHLMVSLDDYHLESISIKYAANCIRHCQKIGIATSVQVLQRKGGSKAEDFKKKLSNDDILVDEINWYESPCSALGNARTMIKKEELEWYWEIPEGGCSAGKILNIQPDGRIKPCCGAGLMADRLSLGNIKTENVYDVVQKSEVDTIVNSLIAEQGPRGLANELYQRDKADQLIRHGPFTDACHACFAMLTDPEILTLLEKFTKNNRIELLAQRVISLHGNKILQEMHK
jgi:MoaA/NifB/PqqE/SkfB family radical SAM enzyme